MQKYQIQCSLDGDFYLFNVKQYSYFFTLNDDDLEKLTNDLKNIADEFETFKNERDNGEFLCLSKCKDYENVSKYIDFEKDIYQDTIIGFTSFKIIFIYDNDIKTYIEYDGIDLNEDNEE